jgi:hypothetical protein
MKHRHLVEQLYTLTQQLDNRLSMYYIVLGSENIIRKLIPIVCSLHACAVCRVKHFSFLDVSSGTTKVPLFNRATPENNRPAYSEEYVCASTQGQRGIRTKASDDDSHLWTATRTYWDFNDPNKEYKSTVPAYRSQCPFRSSAYPSSNPSNHHISLPSFTFPPKDPYPRFDCADHPMRSGPRLRWHLRQYLSMHISWTRRQRRGRANVKFLPCLLTHLPPPGCSQSNSTTVHQC